MRFTIVNLVISSNGSLFLFPPSLSPSPIFRSPISATGLASSRLLSNRVLSSLLYIYNGAQITKQHHRHDWNKRRTCSSLPSPMGSRPKSLTRSACSRASIPARRRVAYVSKCTPRIILTTKKLMRQAFNTPERQHGRQGRPYQTQHRNASAPHFATLIQSS